MGRFVPFSTHRFILGNVQLLDGTVAEEWVDIRDGMSYFERQELNSKMLDVDMKKDGDYSIKADFGKYSPAILEAYVTGWQIFDDVDGRQVAVPFSKAALSRLDEDTCERIVDHISGVIEENDERKKVLTIDSESREISS